MGSLLRIYAVAALLASSHGGVITVLPPFLNDLGFPVHEIGYVSSLLGLMQLVSRMPIGTLYLVRRARRIMFLCLASMALSVTGYSVLHTLPWISLLTALFGLGLGSATTVILALCLDLKPKEYDLGRTMGWFGAAISLGYFTGNLSLSYVADHVGYGPALVVTGLLSAVAFLAIMTIPVPSVSGHAVSDDSAQPTSFPASSPVEESPEGSLRTVILKPDVIAAALVAFALTFVSQTVDAFFPIHALSIGLTLTTIGVLRSMGSVVTGLVRPFTPLSFRFASLRTINAACVLLSAGAMMLLSKSVTLPVLAVLFFAMGLTRGVSRVSGTTLAAQEGRHTGLAAGTFNAGLDLGSIAGPFIGGLIATNTNISVMFRLQGIMLIAFYFVMLGLSDGMGRRVARRAT